MPSRPRRKLIAGGIALVIVLVLAYLWRPLGIVRGPFMLLYKYPAMVTGPLLAAVIFGGLHYAIDATSRRVKSARGRTKSTRAPTRWSSFRRHSDWNPYNWTPSHPLAGPALSAAFAGALVCLVFAIFSSALTQRAIAQNTAYGKLDVATLQGGEVRIKPYEVALNQLQNSLSSPTERVSNMHVVNVDNRLYWTAARDPAGFFRTFTKQTAGIITSDAETSSPGVRVNGPGRDADFKYGPGMQVSDNIRWVLYKKCFTCDVAEMVSIATPRGPVIMVPYIKYKGGPFVKRPTFGGVYLVDPDGRIDDLSPDRARANPMVRNSGRMFPERLARRTAGSYKYILGITNRMFTRKEAYEIADSDTENSQPYLQKFANLPHAAWVTTMTPRGRAGSTGMVMLMDAVTGETRIWKAPQNASYISNVKALDIVRGERLGVNFAGAFRAIEPRQVFPGGRLHFLVSVVPQQANRSTLNVIVDAEKQTVVKVFPATPQGDRDLIAYLNDKPVSGEYDFTGGQPGDLPEQEEDADAGQSSDDDAPTPPSDDAPTGNDEVSTIQRLLERNRRQQDDLDLQERDLQRILEEAQAENAAESDEETGER